MLRAIPVSRDVNAPANLTLDHVVAATTYSAAPTVVGDGYHVRGAGGQSYDAFEIVVSYDAAAGAPTCKLRPWFWVPDHTGITVGMWRPGLLVEDIPDVSTDVRKPAYRITSAPAGATRMYIQVVSSLGAPAPTNVYITVYGISGFVGTTFDDIGAGGGGGGGTSADYFLYDNAGIYTSPADFTAAFASGTTLTLTDLPFVPFLEQFESVREESAAGEVLAVYTPFDHDFAYAAGTLTVTGAAFQATSEFVVTIRGPRKAFLDVLTDFADPRIHRSPRDFTVAFASATTLTITNLDQFVPVVSDFRAVAVQNAAGRITNTYTPRSNDFTWTPAAGGGVLGVAQAEFGAADSFIVFVEGPVNRYDSFIQTLGQNSSYSSPYDFTVAFASATTLDFTGMPFDPSLEQISGVAVMNAAGQVHALYMNTDFPFAWAANPGVGGTLTVTGANFQAGDTAYVAIVTNGPPKASGAGGAGGANNLYVSPQDFNVVYTAATQVTIAGLPYVPVIEQFVSVDAFDASGKLTTYTPKLNAFAYNVGTGVLTVTGANFDALGSFRISIYGPDKAYAQPQDATKTLQLNNVNEFISGSTLIEDTGITDGVQSFYLDMEGYNNFTIQIIADGGSGAVEVHLESTIEDNGTAAAACAYRECTAELVGVAAFAAVGGALSETWYGNTGGLIKYLKVEMNAQTGGANDSDCTIFARRGYGV